MLMLFLTVAVLHIVALVTPGPDFFFVSQTAVSRSRKEAMMGVLGITGGVMVWSGVALLGLNLILEKMAWLHSIIMVGGGVYLCWMGYQMLRGALKKETVAQESPAVELAHGGRSFLKGPAHQPVESESHYLLRQRVFAVRGRQRRQRRALGIVRDDRAGNLCLVHRGCQPVCPTENASRLSAPRQMD